MRLARLRSIMKAYRQLVLDADPFRTGEARQPSFREFLQVLCESGMSSGPLSFGRGFQSYKRHGPLAPFGVRSSYYGNFKDIMMFRELCEILASTFLL